MTANQKYFKGGPRATKLLKFTSTCMIYGDTFQCVRMTSAVVMLLRILFRIKPYRGSGQTRSVKPPETLYFSGVIKIHVGSLA